MVDGVSESSSPVEELVVRCLDRMESEGERGLEELCREHPEFAVQLRERIASLRHAGLVGVAVPTDFPERLGEFRLLERLGGGGMGVVYRAVQESLGRDVALKLIRPEQLYFGQARERFEREVAIVAKLHHPGIVPIYTVGEADGIPFFAMERVDGATLGDIIKKLANEAPTKLSGASLRAALGETGPRRSSGVTNFDGTWNDAVVAIVREVAEALEHAHRRGVLHRDVKPSNVMLTRDGRVMLLDFGLSASTESDRMTRSGAQLGSLPYMAPEQVRGDLGAVDARTDVYQLGVTFYELLTLHLPYEGRSSAGLASEILAGHPQRPSKWNASISADVETVCRAAMDPDPARRYPSAGAFARDLDHVLARRPIEAQRANAWVQAQRWAQRHPAAALSAVLGVLLFIGAPTVLYLQQRSANRSISAARDRAEANFDKAIAAVDLVTDVGEETMRDLPHLEPARKQILEAALAFYRDLAQQESGGAILALELARARGRVADMERLLGNLEVAETEYSAQIDELLALRADGVDDAAIELELSRAHHNRATTREQRDLYVESEQDARAAVAAFESLTRADEGHRAALAGALFTLGNALYGQGRWDEARVCFEDGARSAREVVEAFPDDQHAIAVLTKNTNAIGALLVETSKPEEAVPYLRETVERGESLLARFPGRAKTKEDIVDARVNLGLALSNLRRGDEARAELERGVELQRELVRDFPNTPRNIDAFANISLNYGITLYRSGSLAAATEVYEEAIASQRRLLATNDSASYASLLANLLSSLGACQIDSGDLDSALRSMDEAIEWQEHALALAPDQPTYLARLAEHLMGRSELPRRAGNHVEAVSYIMRGFERSAQHDWIFARRAAGRLAQCAALARDDKSLSEAERAATYDDYAGRAIGAMRTSIERGYRDIEDLRNAEVFASVRELPAFDALFGELDGLAR